MSPLKPLTPEFAEDADRDLLLGFTVLSRRRFLKTAAAAVAASQLPACSKRSEKIVPYVEMPERIIPGRPEFYATTLTRSGIGRGVLVESHLGRPTRIEGNPRHPESAGALDCVTQAEIVTLYDPERSQVPLQGGEARSFDDARHALADLRDRLGQDGGRETFIVAAPSSSPSFLSEAERLRERFPHVALVYYSPVGRERLLEGTKGVFGTPCEPIYRLDAAQTVLSAGGDFLAELPGSLRYARDFISGRKGANPARLISIEPTLSLTGGRADRRYAATPIEIETFIAALAAEMGVLPAMELQLSPALRELLDYTARHLRMAGEKSLIVPGEYLAPEIQGLCHRLNHASGSVDVTVEYIRPVEGAGTHTTDELLSELRAKRVRTLIFLDTNPVYSLSGDEFASLIEAVPVKVHFGLYRDETALQSDWHVPLAHELESWGDARGFDGSVCLQQPLISPLFGGWSPAEAVSFLEGGARDGYTILSTYWRAVRSGDDFENWWLAARQAGVIAENSAEKLTPVPAKKAAYSTQARAEQNGITILLRPDPALVDGRYANNGWLQELPRPFTKLTWDNALLLSPETAKSLALEDGDEVELSHGKRSLIIPVLTLQSLPDGVGSMFLGYGRTHAGKMGSAVGSSAERLRSLAVPWVLEGVVITRRGSRRPLAVTQHHHSMHGRDLVRTVSFTDAAEANAGGTKSRRKRSLSLYEEPLSSPNQWGMSINLDACVGCSACVTACQSENNIPFVGRDEVLRGREMHWIRVDSYFEESEPNPQVLFQPVPCMHCEQAPCEVVCPVGATVHSGEGLNEMVYNRCVGTRYCSNNCPYKVRRFNFFHYTDEITPLLKLLQNPDVTVRGRGVMEKCTYCVQRIEQARIAAGLKGREIKDGEIRTACQQACPTEAIVFGDIADSQSAVSKAKQSELDYELLAELNTRPRTTYLPRLKRREKE